ncbi:24712_t:CDS:2, partial [Racocetra persica]
MSEELFLKANKFYDEMLTEETASLILYLCAFSKNNHNFLEESLTMLQQRKIYRELYYEINSNKENEEFVLQNSKKKCGK